MASSSQSSEHHKLIRIDSISHLPDPLLYHILSFVTTKEAVATSILSKRWQYLWTWVPILYVADRDFYHHKDTSFEDIVSKIMLSRKTRCIRAFRMEWFDDSPDKSPLQSWICSDVSGSIEELDLRIEMEEDLLLPPSLVSCKTLTILKLTGQFVLNVPSSVHLPRLKVLHLWIGLYEGDNSFPNLISSCPALDELVIQRCEADGLFPCEISSSTLTTLILDDCLVKINTLALKYLDLVSSSFAEPPINQLNNLVQANVSGSCSIDMPIQWLDFKKIIYAIYNVKSLELGHRIMKCLSEHIGFFETCEFQNLIKLKVDVESFQNFSGMLEKLLMNSPHLQHFAINNFWKDVEEPECWMPLDAVPHSLSFHLTMFELQGFEGSYAYMDFLRYILKHSKALLDMTISSYSALDLKQLSYFVHELSKFEKGSARCRIMCDGHVVP